VKVADCILLEQHLRRHRSRGLARTSPRRPRAPGAAPRPASSSNAGKSAHAAAPPSTPGRRPRPGCATAAVAAAADGAHQTAAVAAATCGSSCSPGFARLLARLLVAGPGELEAVTRDRGRHQPWATRSSHNAIDCHRLPFLSDLHTNIAVIAATCCQNGSVAPGYTGIVELLARRLPSGTFKVKPMTLHLVRVLSFGGLLVP
jgi:hypothetical protein